MRRAVPAAAYLKTADRSGPKLVLRINALDTPFWEKDLETVVPAKPDMIVVPKSLSGDCVKKVGERIDRLGGADDIGIGCVATETAASLFTLGTYAGSHDRLAFLTWKAEDLSAALGARDNKDENGLYTGPYQLARTLTLLGAVAAGVQPVDSIWKDFRDEGKASKPKPVPRRATASPARWRSTPRRLPSSTKSSRRAKRISPMPAPLWPPSRTQAMSASSRSTASCSTCPI